MNINPNSFPTSQKFACCSSIYECDVSHAFCEAHVNLDESSASNGSCDIEVGAAFGEVAHFDSMLFVVIVKPVGGSALLLLFIGLRVLVF